MPRRYTVRVGRSRFAHERNPSDALGGLDAITSSLIGSEAITHGSQINGTNTGPRVSTTASGVPAGSYVLDQAFLNTYNGGSSVFSAKSFSGVSFWDMAAGLAVTFEDCLLSNGNIVFPGRTDNGLLTLNYCRCVGTADPYNNPNDFTWSQYTFINAHHVRLTRCDVEGFGSGMVTMGDDCRYVECFIHDPAPHQSLANGGPSPDGTHHGCLTIQANSCTDGVISRCHLKAIRGTTSAFNWDMVSAALTWYNDSYHPGPFTITDNWFAGGGVYTSYWGAVPSKPDPYAANKTVTGNKWGREFLRYSGSDGPVTAGDFTGAGDTWSDNTWGPLGVAPSSDPAEGTLIGAPTP